MAFFVPGKVFELQKWTEDESLNGKIVGIIDKKTGKQCYPCYIFETQQIIEPTAAQLTYPELDANNKKKLTELLQDVIEQKKNHQINLAIKAEEEEKKKLLAKQQKEEQQKIQAVIPNVVFDTGSTSPKSSSNGEELHSQSRASIKSTISTQIVIQSPPKDLYKIDDNNQSTDGLLIEQQESTVPQGYALVPVSTLNQVVKIKNQEQELQEKEIELISKENELTLAQKQTAMETKRKEMELEAKQKEIELEAKHLNEIEKDLAQRDRKSKVNTDRMMEEEIRMKQQNRAMDINRDKEIERERMRLREKEKELQHKKKRDSHKKKKDKDRDRDDDEYEERKRKKRKKKKKKDRKKKNDGCTTTKCCKCLCKLSSIFIILALIGGIIGCYFFFLQNDDENIYAFISWAGAVVCAVFGVCFYCKG